MMLTHSSELLRLKAGRVFTCAVQNNIQVQIWALENSALSLLPQYNKETSLKLREQILSSISGKFKM